MGLVTVKALIYNGITLPAPKAPGGMVITAEKIWSSDTGRNAAAAMMGRIIAIKRTLEISWPPLPPEDIARIESAASNANVPFGPLTYTDHTGQTDTIQVYFGTPSYTCFDWVKGQWMVTDATVTAVEK